MAEPIAAPADERGWFSSPPGIAMLWTGILAGPIAWALDLTISYAIVQWTCGSQHTSVLALVTAGALLVIACGAIASGVALGAAAGRGETDGGSPIDRGRFEITNRYFPFGSTMLIRSTSISSNLVGAWRVNAATEVLPLVPVTAAIVPGWRG